MKTLLLLVFCIGLGAHSFSQSDCIDPTSLSYNPDSILDCAGIEGGDDFSCCHYYPPCHNTCFTAYDPNIRVRDCVDEIGGTDYSCCTFETYYSTCCSPIELEDGEELQWWNETAGTSEYSCQENLVLDLWFEFTPLVSGYYYLETSAEFPTAFSIWNGTCLGDDFYSIYCFPNDQLNAVGFKYLVEGESYLIQLGAREDWPFSTFGSGTIRVDLIEDDLVGCSDLLACNYSESVVYELNSCRYEGDTCNDGQEYNNSYYDENCTCIVQYVGDYNGDGVINVQDIGGILSEFGSAGVGEYTTGDLSGDLLVNITDIAIFLSLFGQSLN